jgi:hypothetical protein
MPPLRINLLPAYIAERKKTQGAIVAAALVFALATAAPLFLFIKSQNDVKAMKEEADQLESEASKVDTLNSQASSELAKIQPIQDKVDFVQGVLFYNGWRQKIYRRAAQYTISSVELNSMAVQGNTLSINGYANSVDDLGRYLITFFGNPDVEAVSISGPPGYSAQQQQPVQLGQAPARSGFNFTVTARLIRAITPPVLPQSLGAAGGGAAGGGFGGGGFAGPPPGGFGPPPDAGGGEVPPDGAR